VEEAWVSCPACGDALIWTDFYRARCCGTPVLDRWMACPGCGSELDYEDRILEGSLEVDPTLALYAGPAWTCRRCVQEVIPGWVLCPSCGVELKWDAVTRCGHCRTELEVGWVRCPHCGADPPDTSFYAGRASARRVWRHPDAGPVDPRVWPQVLPDYYHVLGIGRRVDGEAVRAAYRLRAKRLHPDTSKRGDAAALMTQVNEAFRVLSDGALRADYDRIYRLLELPVPPG
jgi:hypothetical protein